MTAVRFGILVEPDAPFDQLVERCRLVEQLGFDFAYVADHAGDHRDPEGYWHDGWTVLAAFAMSTDQIRIGTLVSNPILRGPALLAREAQALDHLSGGRLELGIGTGMARFDHEAAGQPFWDFRERAGRFAEYVEVVDGILSSPSRGYSFEGRYHRSERTPMEPAPVQRPRPPITVGGQSPTVRRIAAERADCWNTHGPFGASYDEILSVTAEQNAAMDEHCERGGRDPGSLRRSLLFYNELDAWRTPDAVERVVSDFGAIGMHEYVLMWPPSDKEDRLPAAAELLNAARS